MFNRLEKLIKNSYSIYSDFSVACIVEMKDGNTFEGVNIENPSFKDGLCAEQVAIGTAISESILRYRSLGEEERNVNFIHRVDLGDNISTLADQYGVSEAYIRKSNSEILNSFNGLVVYDQPMIVSPIPQVLTEKNVIIENNLSVHI